jgi:hypothetical protein
VARTEGEGRQQEEQGEVTAPRKGEGDSSMNRRRETAAKTVGRDSSKNRRRGTAARTEGRDSSKNRRRGTAARTGGRDSSRKNLPGELEQLRYLHFLFWGKKHLPPPFPCSRLRVFWLFFLSKITLPETVFSFSLTLIMVSS